MRKRARAGVVAALATVLVASTSTAAYADYYGCESAGGSSLDCHVIYGDSTSSKGEGWFLAYGERLYAYDGAADGRGVYVNATWWSGSTRHENGFRLTSGQYTSRTLDLGDIAEGTSVTFTTCQTNDGNLLNCRTQTARA
ncbi:hypothetical protein ACGF7U_13575 [Micromonospora sp. NPDC047670]|uniref:hypothetical protein n=1 Tax=Micromonospora sp. NPDC047670 TaxID=3364252 RepID=UPI0037112043